MPRPSVLACAVVLLALGSFALGEASAQGPRDGREDAQRHERGERGADRRSLSDAVRRVERRTGGQVLSAERVPFDGRDVNRVKVLDASGRVRVYMDDPRASRDDPRTRGDDD